MRWPGHAPPVTTDTTSTTDPGLARVGVLRRRLMQAVGAARIAMAIIDNGGHTDPAVTLAQVRAALMDAFRGERLLEPVPCTKGHAWWRIGGESAACPGCRIAELEASARGEIAPGAWPLDMP